MPLKTLNPYAIDWVWEGDNETQDDSPTPDTLWFTPFHQAATSGLVDGSGTHGRGPITAGAVSDQPVSVSNADGSRG